MIHSSIENFQSGQQANSEQKADDISVCPAIANAHVSSSSSLIHKDNKLSISCVNN